MEHWNPEIEQFEVSPIQVDSEWLPPFRIRDLILDKLPKYMTDNRTKRTVEYLTENGSLTEEELAFTQKGRFS